MPARRLSPEDVAVNNIARAHGIDIRETASMAALRAAYQAGQRDRRPDAEQQQRPV